MQDSFTDPFAVDASAESPDFGAYLGTPGASPEPTSTKPSKNPQSSSPKTSPLKKPSGRRPSRREPPGSSSEDGSSGVPSKARLIRVTEDVYQSLRRWALAWEISSGESMSPNKVVRELLSLAGTAPETSDVRRLLGTLEGLRK